MIWREGGSGHDLAGLSVFRMERFLISSDDVGYWLSLVFRLRLRILERA